MQRFHHLQTGLEFPSSRKEQSSRYEQQWHTVRKAVHGILEATRTVMMTNLSVKDVIGIIVFLLGIFGSYFANQMQTDQKISAISQSAAVLQANQVNYENSFSDLKTNVNKLDEKIDALLLSQGINPNKY